MKKLKQKLLANSFSHIYVEKEALDYPLTKTILQKFNSSIVLEINHYKDFFCRTNQSFNMKKKAQKLILAVKKDELIYQGSELCHNFGYDNFFYTSNIYNCIFDCSYCYLQGMYSSGNIVVFVNIEDFFIEATKLLNTKDNLFIAVSYDTDILALESIIPITNKWLDFVKNHPNITIEIRTKSVNYKSISNIKPLDNAILAWTLSPNIIIDKYEKYTPSLENRIKCIKEAMLDGWKVRLCFDPIIKIDSWENVYSEFFNYVFSKIDTQNLLDVSLGVFRMPSDFLKRIRKSRHDSELIFYPFENIGGTCTYTNHDTESLIGFCKSQVEGYIDKNKLWIL